MFNDSSEKRAAHYQAQRDASLERMKAAKKARLGRKTVRLTPKYISPGGKKTTRKNRRKSRRNK